MRCIRIKVGGGAGIHETRTQRQTWSNTKCHLQSYRDRSMMLGFAFMGFLNHLIGCHQIIDVIHTSYCWIRNNTRHRVCQNTRTRTCIGVIRSRQSQVRTQIFCIELHRPASSLFMMRELISISHYGIRKEVINRLCLLSLPGRRILLKI